jgi:chromosome transmission fidelity protein 1
VSRLSEHLSATKPGTSSLLGLTEFMFAIKCDNVNLCKLDRYITRADLNRKLLGFLKAAAPPPGEAPQAEPAFVSKHVSPLAGVHQFLQRLMGAEADGKVVVAYPPPTAFKPTTPSVRYFMLNPSACFDEVASSAATTILAGGTLRPFSHIASELMPASSLAAASLADERDYDEPVTEGEGATFFSCDHVVARENVHTLAVSHGPDGSLLEFNYANRGLEKTIDALGRAVANLCNVVPAGLVVFLPSYS